jgi:tetratricopeptide (TPR) repeat protein
MRAFAAAALMAATILPPVQASAQQSTERDECFAQNGVSPDLSLSACTAVIESGKESPRVLTDALMRRGNAYFNDKNDYDRAIQDYDAIIRIDPNKALAFNNRGNGYLRKAQYDRALQDFDQAIHRADRRAREPPPAVAADLESRRMIEWPRDHSRSRSSGT